MLEHSHNILKILAQPLVSADDSGLSSPEKQNLNLLKMAENWNNSDFTNQTPNSQASFPASFPAPNQTPPILENFQGFNPNGFTGQPQNWSDIKTEQPLDSSKDSISPANSTNPGASGILSALGNSPFSTPISSGLPLHNNFMAGQPAFPFDQFGDKKRTNSGK